MSRTLARDALPRGRAAANICGVALLHCMQQCAPPSLPSRRAGPPPAAYPPPQEYEVCVLKQEINPRTLKSHDIKWSVWRRYSDFELLDKCVAWRLWRAGDARCAAELKPRRPPDDAPRGRAGPSARRTRTR